MSEQELKTLIAANTPNINSKTTYTTYCAGFWVFNGNKRSIPFTGPCHGDVRRSPHRQEAIAFSTRIKSSILKDDVIPGFKRYVDWLVNHSYFRDVFIVKDIDFILDYGFIKTIDVHSNVWLGAAQLARLSTSELSHKFTTFCRILTKYPKVSVPKLFYLFFKVPFIWETNDIIGSTHINVAGYGSSHLPFNNTKIAGNCYFAAEASLLSEKLLEYPEAQNNTIRQRSWTGASSLISGLAIAHNIIKEDYRFLDDIGRILSLSSKEVILREHPEKFIKPAAEVMTLAEAYEQLTNTQSITKMEEAATKPPKISYWKEAADTYEVEVKKYYKPIAVNHIEVNGVNFKQYGNSIIFNSLYILKGLI